MSILTQVDYDVNDEIIWMEFVNYVPAIFPHLVSRGVEPEVAADILADDGLPVCDNPPKIAIDGGEAVEWSGMYEEIA